MNDPQRDTSENEESWLSRPSTIRRLWIVFIVVLALTVLAQLLFPVTGHFGVDGWFGFGAVYGFLSCVAMVLTARVLGLILKQPYDYYDD